MNEIFRIMPRFVGRGSQNAMVVHIITPSPALYDAQQLISLWPCGCVVCVCVLLRRITKKQH